LLAIGLTLVLVHIVCIPITGTSVNPARSIAPALFQGGEALSQLFGIIWEIRNNSFRRKNIKKKVKGRQFHNYRPLLRN
jgi:hypothetical protein